MNIEIYTNNTAFQISTLENQKNNPNNISSIDLKDCENILKEHYNIQEEEELVLFKLDVKQTVSTIVQYEVYHPSTLEKLDLSICKNVQISINLPVDLDDEIQSLYEILDEYGYCLFNISDLFYNDICTKYTTINGTDINLNDRRQDIYGKISNLSLCQTGCSFQSFNLSNKKVECSCEPETDDISFMLSNLTYAKEQIIENFYLIIRNINFKVLNCYKLLYIIKDLKNNIGCIIMTIIYLLLLIFLIYCCFTGAKDINYFIQLILIKIKNLDKNKNNNKKVKINDSNKLKNVKNSSKNIKKNTVKNIHSKNIQDNKKKLKEKDITLKSKQKNKNLSLKKKKLLNDLSNGSSCDINSILKLSNQNIKDKNKNSLKSTNKNSIYNVLTIHKKNKNNPKNKINSTINNDKYLSLNDQELNNLTYKEAIKYDKRTYFQYYCSLIKRNQILLFSFFPNNDYNLRCVKISLLLLSFSLSLTINGIFFNDDTMHKLYKDKGKNNFIFRIPQILNSSIISSIITTILRLLALSESNILSIKKAKNYISSYSKSNQTKKTITIKIIIFYVISIILLSFFWLYISCFCAVYENTQIILIKDSLISFSTSMIYPFGLNFIPGIFRISALRSSNNRECIYQISKYVAYI